MKFIKLSKNIKADSGDIFKKGSIVQIVTNGTKANPSVDVIPMNAVDDDNLPYRNGIDLFTFSNFKESEHSQVKSFIPKTAEFNYPGNVLEDDDKTDGITIGLRDAYADKDYELDINGNVEKKASMQRKAEAFNENVIDSGNSTTDFSTTVEGEDDPGFNDNHKEDVSEKPTPSPMAGALARKVRILKGRLKRASEENNLLPNDADTSIDFDMGVDGSGTVTDNYKEDTATKPTPAPMMGELAKLRKQMSNLKRKVKRAEVSGDSFTIDNVTDGDSMGDNLDDYSVEGDVEDGSNDEFSPKEARRKLSKKK